MKFWSMKSGKAIDTELEKYSFSPKDDITVMELAKLMRCVFGADAYDFQVKAMPPEVRRHFDIINTSKTNSMESV